MSMPKWFERSLSRPSIVNGLANDELKQEAKTIDGVGGADAPPTLFMT